MPIQFSDKVDVQEFTPVPDSLLDELFWGQEQLAEFRYQAFLIESGLETESIDESLEDDSIHSLLPDDSSNNLEDVLQMMHSSLPVIDADFSQIATKQKLQQRKQHRRPQDRPRTRRVAPVRENAVLVSSPFIEENRKKTIPWSPAPTKDTYLKTPPTISEEEDAWQEEEQHGRYNVISEASLPPPPVFTERKKAAPGAPGETGQFKSQFPSIPVKGSPTRPPRSTRRSYPLLSASAPKEGICTTSSSPIQQRRRSIVLDKLDKWSLPGDEDFLELHTAATSRNATEVGVPPGQKVKRKTKKKKSLSMSSMDIRKGSKQTTQKAMNNKERSLSQSGDGIEEELSRLLLSVDVDKDRNQRKPSRVKPSDNTVDSMPKTKPKKKKNISFESTTSASTSTRTTVSLTEDD